MRASLTPLRGCVRRRDLLSRATRTPANIVAAVLHKVRAANLALVAEGVLPAGIDQSRIVVEPPRDKGHGDLATNAAMVLAREARCKPRDLAAQIVAKLG